MSTKRTLRHAAVAVMLLVAFLFQGTWALAGTTGGLTGQVTDASGAPIAGATVNAASPSQAASATTDARGRFSLLALSPDSYSVAVEKEGYDPVSYTGVSVFADNTLSLSFKLNKTLKTIAKVTSRSTGEVVKPGVTTDIYNVNATAIQKSAALGGGGNLNSAYSAIASVPGVIVPIGGSGWNNNSVYVRGSQSFFTGFEYDGIPVNRAFDNYNSSTESNLGLQELQVYTGGGPSSNSSSGTAGFINQVIKTGTYPGFGSVDAGIAGPTFYHQLKVEAGGATPDRRFSYYVGLSGYNQEFRFLDNNNGASLMNPGGIYSGNSSAPVFTLGTIPQCNPDGSLNLTTPQPWLGGTGCIETYPGIYGHQSSISDRENVVNFHFGIPRKNGLRDDLQLLYSSSSLVTTDYSSINDAGGVGPFTLAVTGSPYVAPNGTPNDCAPGDACYPAYVDATVYNLPFGTPIAGHSTEIYYQPSSPQNRVPGGPLPNTLRDNIWNDTGIAKLQYTHALSDHAYVRLFGYTFFSDWTQAGAVDAWSQYVWGIGGPGAAASANYDLITHTAGGELQFADQLNEKNLVELTGNYTTAHVSRYNNTGYTLGTPAGNSPIGIVSLNNGGIWLLG